MDTFMGILIGVALVALALGFLAGHYHAMAPVRDFIAAIAPGVKADFSAAELELVATFRKITGKDKPAPIAETVAPPVT